MVKQDAKMVPAGDILTTQLSLIIHRKCKRLCAILHNCPASLFKPYF
jgi:hypothetical protein